MKLQVLSAAEIIVNKLQSWFYATVEMLPNIVLAAMVVAGFFYLARFAHKLFNKVVYKFSTHYAINGFLGTAIHIAVLCVGIFIALGLLKLDKTVVSLLAGAGIIGLALSFAFQDTAANFIAGIILAIKHPIHVGDLVKVKEFFGTVERINLRSTFLRTSQDQMIIIPNKDVLQNPIQNYSITGNRSIDLSLSVSATEDLDRVREVTITAIKQINYLQQGKKINVYFEEFSGDSINFTVRYWVNSLSQDDYKQALSDGIVHIKRAFHRNGFLPPLTENKADIVAENINNELAQAGEEISEMIIKAEVQNGLS